ncbi:MAG: hypothetical protein ACNI3C_02770 [Candidatus Marinarcus sp.]|uniref:hypothetical protein n=1 Tax=Candidatus Marinarcus sp. TaxID=3100987 RepID=UPI003B007C1A
MSLKENVDFVKEELNSEEKFLESFVKVERFYKKYKLLIIVGVTILVLGTIGYNVKNYINKSNKLEANIAFNELLKNPSDKEALETLKNSNVKLYNVALYLQAKDSHENVEINERYLKNLLEYSKAIQSSDVEKLNTLSMQNDFLLKEFALFNKALILTQQEKYSEAKETLKLIKQDSKVNDLVVLLNHYLLTK